MPTFPPSLAERSEARAVNRALRARIRRKLEAYKQEATQLPRLSSLRRRESVLCTNGILIIRRPKSRRVRLLLPGGFTLLKWFPLGPPRTKCVSVCKTKHSRAEVLLSGTVRGGGGLLRSACNYSLAKQILFAFAPRSSNYYICNV